MAIIQKPVPRTFERPAVLRPQPRRSARAPYSNASLRVRACPGGLSLVVSIAVLACLVLYIAGHAAMTRVTYQRVQILNQIRAIRAQNQVLHNEIIQRTSKYAIAEWAKAHGMTPTPSVPVVIVRGPARGE